MVLAGPSRETGTGMDHLDPHGTGLTHGETDGDLGLSSVAG